METFYKDPDALLDYSVDWSDWLESGETISISSWAVSSVDVTISNSSNSTTGATVWLSGGVAGETCVVTNSIETAGGVSTRKEDRSFILKVEER